MMILHAKPLRLLASKAWFNVVISYKTQPSAHMSLLWLYLPVSTKTTPRQHIQAYVFPSASCDIEEMRMVGLSCVMGSLR